MTARLVLGVLALILAACASGLSEDYAFTSDSSDAIIVLGTKGLVGYESENYAQFDSIDLSTNRLDGKSSFQIPAVKGASDDRSYAYRLFVVEPGTYVLSRRLKVTVTSLPVAKRVSFRKYCDGSHAFTVRPGRISFIGNYDFTYSKPKSTGNLADARKVLDRYPNIEGEIEAVDLSFVTFKGPTGECTR